jgi:hypothetical protein
MVTQKEGEDKAEEIGACFYAETSAITGEGVMGVLRSMACEILRGRGETNFGQTEIRLQAERKEKRCC